MQKDALNLPWSVRKLTRSERKKYRMKRFWVITEVVCGEGPGALVSLEERLLSFYSIKMFVWQRTAENNRKAFLKYWDLYLVLEKKQLEIFVRSALQNFYLYNKTYFSSLQKFWVIHNDYLKKFDMSSCACWWRKKLQTFRIAIQIVTSPEFFVLTQMLENDLKNMAPNKTGNWILFPV